MSAFPSAMRPVEPASVHVLIDELRLRVHVRIKGPATGELVADRISRLFLERPELTDYDMLYDLTAYTGEVQADEIPPIVDAYARVGPEPAVPCRTAFVTADRTFHEWATAMDRQFPGREHRAFPHAGPALRFLDEPLLQRRRGR